MFVKHLRSVSGKSSLRRAVLSGKRGITVHRLKDIADAIGMSQPGLLHYIGNKERLLSLLVTDNYDQEGTPVILQNRIARAAIPEGMLFPAYLRFLVTLQ